MFEAIADRLRRSPSKYNLALERVRESLSNVKENVMDGIMHSLEQKDPSVVIIEHESPGNPASLSHEPSVVWAIHYDLKPVEDIEMIKRMSWWKRRRVPTIWNSRAVGLSADLGGVRDVVYTTIKNGRGSWEDIDSNLEYVGWCLSKGSKPSEMSVNDALNYAISLALPLGDLRFGSGYRGIDRKPRNSRYWRMLD